MATTVFIHRPDLNTIILGKASTSKPPFPFVRVFSIAHLGIRRSRPLCLVAKPILSFPTRHPLVAAFLRIYPSFSSSIYAASRARLVAILGCQGRVLRSRGHFKPNAFSPMVRRGLACASGIHVGTAGCCANFILHHSLTSLAVACEISGRSFMKNVLLFIF